MKYINFLNQKISKLSLGTVQFGLEYGIANKNGKPNQETVNSIIDYVYESGINCFDTAQAYGNSEKVLGKAISNKIDIRIVSKVKSELFVDSLEDAIKTSLDNLGVGSLFGLLLHDSKLLHKWNKKHEEAVKKLTDNGLIQNFGVSIYTSEEFELAIKNKSIKFIQIPFNLFDQRAIKERWFEKAKKAQKLIFIRSIFLQGLLLMDKNDIPAKIKKAIPYIEKLDELCYDLKTTKNELALNFVDSYAKDSVILFGCENIEQAKENLHTYKNLRELNENELDYIANSFKHTDEIIYNPSRWQYGKNLLYRKQGNSNNRCNRLFG